MSLQQNREDLRQNQLDHLCHQAHFLNILLGGSLELDSPTVTNSQDQPRRKAGQ